MSAWSDLGAQWGHSVESGAVPLAFSTLPDAKARLPLDADGDRVFSNEGYIDRHRDYVPAPTVKTVRGDADAGEDWVREDGSAMYRTVDDEEREWLLAEFGLRGHLATDITDAPAFGGLTDYQFNVAELILNENLSDDEIAERLGKGRGDIAKIRTVILPKKLAGALDEEEIPQQRKPTPKAKQYRHEWGGPSLQGPLKKAIIAPTREEQARMAVIINPTPEMQRFLRAGYYPGVPVLHMKMSPKEFVTLREAEDHVLVYNALGTIRPDYQWGWSRLHPRPGYGIRYRRRRDINKMAMEKAAEKRAATLAFEEQKALSRARRHKRLIDPWNLRWGWHPPTLDWEPPGPKPRPSDEAIKRARDQGAAFAASSGSPVDCPYGPADRPWEYAAWMKGFQEEQERRQRNS